MWISYIMELSVYSYILLPTRYVQQTFKSWSTRMDKPVLPKQLSASHLTTLTRNRVLLAMSSMMKLLSQDRYKVQILWLEKNNPPKNYYRSVTAMHFSVNLVLSDFMMNWLADSPYLFLKYFFEQFGLNKWLWMGLLDDWCQNQWVIAF